MEEHWRGALPDGPPAVCYRGPSERATVLPGLARMRLTERGAEVRVAPGADWCLNLGCLLPALCDLLARCGHYVVHAATLCATHSPDGTGVPPVPPALLLCGPSGVGKTTTTLATALHLAAALFRGPACSALVQQAPCLSRAGRLCHRIRTPHAVLHPKSFAARARRQVYRELLKRR